MKDRAQRVLVVAARPDDEAYSFGATIATLVQRGTEVIVLSCKDCTLAQKVVRGGDGLIETEPAAGEVESSRDAQAQQILGIEAHHILRENSAESLESAPARELAADLASAITALKPDVVVSYAKDRCGSRHPDEARKVHEAVVLATELAAVPFYMVSTSPVDRGVAVSQVRALAYKRRAMEIYENLGPLGESTQTPVEYLRRLRRRDLVIGERSQLERVILACLSLVIGALVGLVLTAVHQSTINLGGFRFPWGVIAAVVLVSALIVGLRLIYDTRVAAGFASLGVLLMSALLANAMPDGTVLIPGNVSGYVWTFAPVLVILLVLGWPRVNRLASQASRDSIEMNSPVKGADNS